MRHFGKRTAALALLIALALAACGDSDDDDGSGDGGEAAATSTAAVSAAEVDGTEVLADADGRTLYTADAEAGGEILCTGPCASIWDPALGSGADAEAAAEATGAEIGTVERPDGERQLTLDGAPLYSFTEEGPGELTGDGFTDEFEGGAFVWSVASSPGAEAPATDDSGGDTGGGYGGGGYGGY